MKRRRLSWRERAWDRGYKRAYKKVPESDEEVAFVTVCLTLFSQAWAAELPWDEDTRAT